MTKKVGDYMKPDKFLASLWRRINKTDTCWLWTGRRLQKGYGRMTLPEGSRGEVREALAHRFMYEMLVGPIPEGMHLDHLCRNTRCVNPAHLEPITRADHARREQSRRRLARLVTAYERVMRRAALRLEGA